MEENQAERRVTQTDLITLFSISHFRSYAHDKMEPLSKEDHEDPVLVSLSKE